MKSFTIRFLATLLFLLAPWQASVSGQARGIILSTTTSTQDSGLLDVLVPLFEKDSGYAVKTIAVGTGQALAMAERGDADVVLAHAPGLEKDSVAKGKLFNRRLVMYNDFVIAGPKNDPAKIRGGKSASAALRAIAHLKVPFASRGDRSGTHAMELSLWKSAALTPAPPWYIESGQGMGATLNIANERSGYALTDRGTFLALAKRLGLEILVQGDRLLLNDYSVLEANPANGARVNSAGGRAFADFMVSPRAQKLIDGFGADKFGQPLFVPVAGLKEEELGV